MHLKIGYFLRFIAALNRVGLGFRSRLWLFKALRVVFPVVVDGGSTWLFKLLLKAVEHLIINSRSDADAQAALAILKGVHGGRGAMYRDRIADQMCREADEELSYYSDVSRGNMSVIIYNLSSGCRLWVQHVAGWGDRCRDGVSSHPGDDDGDMFWRRQSNGETGTANAKSPSRIERFSMTVCSAPFRQQPRTARSVASAYESSPSVSVRGTLWILHVSTQQTTVLASGTGSHGAYRPSGSTSKRCALFICFKSASAKSARSTSTSLSAGVRPLKWTLSGRGFDRARRHPTSMTNRQWSLGPHSSGSLLRARTRTASTMVFDAKT